MLARPRLLFVLPSLHAGGAERVIVRVLTHLQRGDAELHLAVIAKAGQFLRDIPADVIVHDLRCRRLARAVGPLVRLIWKLQPQAVLSTLSHVNLALSTSKSLFPSKTRLILREANVCQRLLGHSRIHRWAYRRAYRQADTIICQSDFMRADLQQNLGLSPEKLVRIYNPLDVTAAQKMSHRGSCPLAEHPSRPRVVSVGSLQSVKGFDRLIRHFPALRMKQPDAQAWIIGQGPLRDELNRQAAAAGLTDHIHFAGFQANPFAWLRHADLFVSASRFDCAPNVLLEAIACGCPVIVRDHPGGTREIMERVGQGHRVVSRLADWESWWFERPDAQPLAELRTHFDVRVILRQYEAVLFGSPAAEVRRAAA